MSVPTKTQEQFVQDMISAWGAAIGIAPTFSSGDILLALFQAVATQDGFLLGLIQIVAALTRAGTSNGSDLDSWVQQFGMARLPATSATGPITYGKNGLANAAITIPVGSGVQSADGLVQFAVVADTTQSAWNATLGAYVLAAGTSSAVVTASGSDGGHIWQCIGRPPKPDDREPSRHRYRDECCGHSERGERGKRCSSAR